MASGRDPSAVKWSHATNSKKKLLEAVASDAVDFIEADVLMGRTESGLQNVPIMAHPPDTSSDISLAEWIEIATKAESSKGLKLDFKDIDSVEPCLNTLRKTLLDSDREIWLNADILEGPGRPKKEPVDLIRFLNLTSSAPLKHTLSIGWTTGLEPEPYTWRNILDMLSVVEDVRATTPVTFTVRLSKLAFHPLALLVSLERSTSLTVWSHENETVTYEEAILLHRAFPGKIYYDLPAKQAADLEHEIATSEAVTPARISVARSEMRTQAYCYSVITEGAGVISLTSDKPTSFKCHRINGNVEVAEVLEDTAPKPTKQTTLRLTGSGRIVLYPAS